MTDEKIETALLGNRRGLAFRKRTVFIAVGLAVSIYFTQQSMTFPLGSGLFPMVIGFAAIGLSLAELILELRGGGGEFETMDVSVDETSKGPAAMRRALRYLAWILGIYAGTALIGFNITIILFFILFMRIEGHVQWWLVLLLTAIAAALELYFFQHLLGMEWPRGLLQNVFDIPF